LYFIKWYFSNFICLHIIWGAGYMADSDSNGPDEAKVCMSNKLQCDAHAAHPWTILPGEKVLGDLAVLL
jgi:hypothetical protein